MFKYKKEIGLMMIIIVDIIFLLRHYYQPLNSKFFTMEQIWYLIILLIISVVFSILYFVWAKFSSLDRLCKIYSKNKEKYKKRYKTNLYFLRIIMIISLMLGIGFGISSFFLYYYGYNYIWSLITSISLFNGFVFSYITKLSTEIIFDKISKKNFD